MLKNLHISKKVLNFALSKQLKQKEIMNKTNKNELRYKVWADSESIVEMPNDVNPFYKDIDAAHDAACELAHKHDGQPYRAIFHIEDLVNEETVDTIENVYKTWW